MSEQTAGRSAVRRGRQARRPDQIPPRGWRDIATRIRRRLIEDDITLVAAGVAFYALLSLFPALAAFVSLYGLVADADEVSAQLLELGDLLPAEAQSILEKKLTELTQGSSGSLGTGVALGLLLSLWSARRGAGALVTALNIAYGEDERRGFFARQLLSIVLVLGALVLAGIAIGLILVLPLLARILGIDAGLPAGLTARWPVLAVLFLLALSLLYRFGPCRRGARWHWIGWGSGVATVLWLAACALFAPVLGMFGRVGETYGTVSGVVILLLWLFVSALVILLGAEINAETEHQTRVDTTVGPDRPMGERGAWVADTVGESRAKDAESDS